MDGPLFTSIPRLITIIVALSLYVIAIATLFRRSRKVVSLPKYDRSSKPVVVDNERRIYARAPLDIGVRYRPYGQEGQIQIFREGKTGNISEGGIYLETGEHLTVESLLELKLKLPVATHFILARGKIVWVKEIASGKWYNYGVSFLEIDPNDRKLIAKYVSGPK